VLALLLLRILASAVLAEARQVTGTDFAHEKLWYHLVSAGCGWLAVSRVRVCGERRDTAHRSPTTAGTHSTHTVTPGRRVRCCDLGRDRCVVCAGLAWLFVCALLFFSRAQKKSKSAATRCLFPTFRRLKKLASRELTREFFSH
jgi:hypothetical protein